MQGSVRRVSILGEHMVTLPRPSKHSASRLGHYNLQANRCQRSSHAHAWVGETRHKGRCVVHTNEEAMRFFFFFDDSRLRQFVAASGLLRVLFPRRQNMQASMFVERPRAKTPNDMLGMSIK